MGLNVTLNNISFLENNMDYLRFDDSIKMIKEYASKSLSKEEVKIVDCLIADSAKKFVMKGERIDLRKPIGEKYYEKMEECSRHLIRRISAVFNIDISDEGIKQIESESRTWLHSTKFADNFSYAERFHKTLYILDKIGWETASILVRKNDSGPKARNTLKSISHT